MVGEVVAGILAHSLALLSDAAHMVTDAAAHAMSLVVIRLMRRPAAGTSRRSRWGSLIVRLVPLLALVALLSATSASVATITRHAETRSYKPTLDVGPLETMYTEAQVKTMHPKTGEVMVGSSMGGSGMSMGKGTRHLEVHVYSRATAKVVTGVVPTIGLHDKTAMSSMNMTVKVPAVAMEGVGEGTADLHYGNNVPLTAGHTYEVVVTVDKQTATFTFRA
jgi:cation efflux family protein